MRNADGLSMGCDVKGGRRLVKSRGSPLWDFGLLGEGPAHSFD